MRVLFMGFWTLGIMLLGGCGEKPVVEGTTPNGDDVQSVEIELRTNRLEGLPGEVYRTQANSRIKWYT